MLSKARWYAALLTTLLFVCSAGIAWVQAEKVGRLAEQKRLLERLNAQQIEENQRVARERDALQQRVSEHTVERDRLAAQQHTLVAPGMRPGQPALHPLRNSPPHDLEFDFQLFRLAAENGQTVEIVEAAAVIADHHTFDPVQHGVKRIERASLVERGQLRILGSSPVLGAWPPVAPQVHPDFDVQVLGQKRLDRVAFLVLAAGDQRQLSLQPVLPH